MNNVFNAINKQTNIDTRDERVNNCITQKKQETESGDAFAPKMDDTQIESWCQQNTSGGGKAKKPNLKATDKRVTVGKAKRVVYKGPRGGEYVKMNGKFVSVKSL